ncbi:cytochrome P450 [Xylariaceae sp. FL1272]|nr:cytochrome P450 [Xylariaceae sp. FL1272]
MFSLESSFSGSVIAQLCASNRLFGVASLLALYTILKVVYRLSFHPLARFPGPKLAAVSSAFEFYYSVGKGGMFPWKLKEMHARYGPVVRITPNELHFSDPDFYREIHTSQSMPRDKYAPFYRFTGATLSAFETHSSGLHNSRRQPLLNAFSKRAIADIEPLVWAKVNLLTERLQQAGENKTPVTLDAAFSALTADITSEYGFGRCLGYLDDENFKNDIRESLLASLSLFHIVRFFPFIMSLAKFLPYRLVQFLNPSLSKVLGLRRLIRAMVLEELGKIERGVPCDAMLIRQLSNPKIPQSERSLERLCDEGFVFLNAGVTAGKTLAFAVFQLLARDKLVWNKLRDELAAAFPDLDSFDHIAQRDLEAVPYLRWVVLESLRLSIGPLTRLPRTAPAGELMAYKEWVIPAGTGISESNYFLHMNPELFPNPTEFIPERWNRSHEKGQRLENYIVTFGRGTRQCLGMNLAYSELYVTLAVLVTRFDMELYKTTEKDVEVVRDKLFGYPLGPSQGVRVIPSVARK